MNNLLLEETERKKIKRIIMQVKGYYLILQFQIFWRCNKCDSKSNLKNNVSSSNDTSGNVLGDWVTIYYQHKN